LDLFLSHKDKEFLFRFIKIIKQLLKLLAGYTRRKAAIKDCIYINYW